MKKSVLFLTAALSFGVAGAQTTVATTTAQAPTLTDVPAGHWAKDAVERLVSQGIILGYPDGTFRGTQNLTRYEAAMIISRLLEQVGSGQVDLGKVDDTTMASLRNAINELSAELAALDVRVSDLEDSAVSREDFARLEGRVNAIASSDAGKVAEDLAAVNEMTTLLNQDVLELQDRVTAIDGELSSFDERLGVVEDQVAENTSDIDGQGIRIASLENGRVKLTLGLGGSYGRLDQTAGNTPFDVDRTTEGTFGQAQYTKQTSEGVTGNDRVRGADTEANSDGFTPGITLGISAQNIDAGNGVVVEEAGVDFGFALGSLVNSTRLGADAGTTDAAFVTLSGARVTGRIGEDARFRVLARAGSVQDDAGQLPLRPDVVNTADKAIDGLGYNDYLLPSGAENGVSAGVTLSDLPLSPTAYITVGRGTGVVNGDNKPTTLGAGTGLPAAPYFGGRLEAKVGANANAGVSFLQLNSDANLPLPIPNVPNPRAGATAVSVDGSYSQPAAEGEGVLWGVKGVYAAVLPDVFAARDFARQTNREADIGALLDSRQQAAELSGEVNLFNVGAKANFRAVSKDYNAFDINENDDFSPTYLDEVGYGASLSTKIGNAEIGAYGDTYTNYYDQDWANRRAGVGAHVGSNLNAFRVVGFASRATDERVPATGNLAGANSAYVAADNPVVRYVNDTTRWAGTGVSSGVRAAASNRADTIFAPSQVTNLYRYTTGVGALVTHDGTASNALISNLDLAAMGLYNYDSSDSYLAGYAGYNAKAANGLTVTPFVGASVYEQNAVNRDGAADNSRVQGGVRVSTAAMDYAFKPQFKAALGAAYYQTGAIDASGTDGNNGQGRAAVNGNQWGGTAEVVLNEFFSPTTKLSLGYGYRQVNGLRDDVAGNNSRLPANVTDFRFGGPYATPVADARFNNSNNTQGVFTQLSWNDALKFNYGIFRYDQDINSDKASDINVAQGFKVTYGVKF